MFKNSFPKIKTSAGYTILITAGGTGGHIYPAESLALEFNKINWSVIFITDRRGRKFINCFPPNVKIYTQEIISLNLRNPFKFIVSIFLLCKSILNSLYLLFFYKPNLVVGFGGYPTFPTILTATFFGFKIILHEGNAVLGRVNKFFSRKADVIACSFWPMRDSIGVNMVFTGNPIRSGLLEKKFKPFNLPTKGNLNLVVIGGSQGAKFFSNIVPDSISHLSTSLKKRIFITHQAKSDDCEDLKNKYDKMGVRSSVESFFNNIEEIFSTSHLIIARAGASTISEAMFFGRPLILIPIKNSIFDHQKLNAEVLSKKGAAFCIDEEECNYIKLAYKINKILTDNKLATLLSTNAKSIAIPEASSNLKKIVLKTFNGENIESKD